MPAETVDIVSNKEVTINFHHWCLTPQNFSAFHMENFWKMLATGKDINQLGKYSVDHQWCQRGSPKGATFKGPSRWLSNIAIGNGGGFLVLFFYIIGVGFLGASSVTSLKVQTVCNNESRYQYCLTSYFTVLPSATLDKLLLPNLLNIIQVVEFSDGGYKIGKIFS